MKRILFPVVLIVFCFVVSCKKNNDNSTGYTPGNCRMTEESSGIVHATYFYDQDNRIIKKRYISSPHDTSWENYTYENGHVIYMIRLFKGTKGDTIVYIYKDDKYVEVDQYGSVLKYLYNTSGQLVRIESYTNSKMTDYSEFDYDQNSNCIRCTEYYKSDSAFYQSTITELEYGDRKNIYYSLGCPPSNSEHGTTAQFLSPNNIVKYRNRFLSNHMTITWIYNYTSFNEHGYPLTFTMNDTITNSILNMETISYVCP